MIEYVNVPRLKEEKSEKNQLANALGRTSLREKMLTEFKTLVWNARERIDWRLRDLQFTTGFEHYQGETSYFN